MTRKHDNDKKIIILDYDSITFDTKTKIQGNYISQNKEKISKSYLEKVLKISLSYFLCMPLTVKNLIFPL